METLYEQMQVDSGVGEHNSAQCSVHAQDAAIGGGLCASEGVEVLLRIWCSRVAREHAAFRHRCE